MARHKTHRKPRAHENRPDKNPVSAKRRFVSRALDKKDYGQALTALDALAQNGGNSSEVLSGIAGVLCGQCKYNQAAVQYGRAAAMCQSDLNANWFGPVIGQVRALLSQASTDEAWDVASAAMKTVEVRRALFAQQLKQARSNATTGQQAVVLSRPTSRTRAGDRLARCFYNEGEYAFAQQLWSQALSVKPSAKTYLGLAQISLSAKQYTSSKQFARQALVTGKFGAKSISAWKLLLQSMYLNGDVPTLKTDLLAGLSKAPESVQARAYLVISTTLRDQKQRVWMDYANSYLNSQLNEKFPIISTEFRKLLVASSANDPGDDSYNSATTALLNGQSLSLSEYIHAAKSQVRASCASGKALDSTAVANNAVSAYGQNCMSKVLHSMAMVYIRNGWAEAGKPLLMQVFNAGNLSPAWSKAVWALAKNYEMSGDYLNAGKLYDTLSSQPSTPSRYKLVSTFAWVSALIKAGNVGAIQAGQARVLAILEGSQDYDLVLNFARQLRVGFPDLQDFAQTLYQTGIGIIGKILTSDLTPSTQLLCRYRLARRQIDFEDYGAITSSWEAMSELQRDQLWSAQDMFWDYVAVMHKAYVRQGNIDYAIKFVDAYIQDEATPLEAKSSLSVRKGESQMYAGNPNDAVVSFKDAVLFAPSNELTAVAYYWLSLSSYHSKDLQGCLHLAATAHEMLMKQSLLWQKELDRRTTAILLYLSGGGDLPNSNGSQSDLQRGAQTMRDDLGRFDV